MMLYKYIVKNIAQLHGKTVTLLPKLLFADNGSGVHAHQSLWEGNKPVFAGNEYAGLSKVARHYIGRILKHARALCAICNPTTNSYEALVPGYEAPVNLAYSARNRSAAIRIPMFSEDFIAMWVTQKWAPADAVRIRPRPYEFMMYYDA